MPLVITILGWRYTDTQTQIDRQTDRQTHTHTHTHTHICTNTHARAIKY